jgi:hypothetical protein
MAILGNKRIESAQLTFTDGASSTANFTGLCRRILLATDADVYINFDADADSTCFVLSPSNCQVYMNDMHFTTINAKGVSGSGTLYVIASRE